MGTLVQSLAIDGLAPEQSPAPLGGAADRRAFAQVPQFRPGVSGFPRCLDRSGRSNTGIAPSGKGGEAARHGVGRFAAAAEGEERCFCVR
jgi:hypothetical protein